MIVGPRDNQLIERGVPSEYYRSLSDIARLLDEWRATCREYDADPDGWIEHQRVASRRRRTVKSDLGRKDRTDA